MPMVLTRLFIFILLRAMIFVCDSLCERIVVMMKVMVKRLLGGLKEQDGNA
jgi:hypothetical protein